MYKQNFDLGWEFTETVGMQGMAFAKWEPINLPHDLSITKPRRQDYPTGKSGGYAWSGVVTYRKRFVAVEAWRSQRVQLEFEGVYMNAEVWLNGHLLGLHPYGYTSFFVDLTPLLTFDGENELIVVVNNSAQPNSRWYTGTGIYRHVWLRTGGKTGFEPWGVFVTTPKISHTAATVRVVTELVIEPQAVTDVTLQSTVFDPDGTPVGSIETAVSGDTAVQSITIEDPLLWSVDTPHLYKLYSELIADGVVIDTESTNFGIRTITVDAENGFQLNGVPMKLRGGCVHHDNGLLGAASYDRAEERKIELMKAAGYNAVRCSHNPPAPAMLDACDSLGMLVINESFDCWRMGKNPNDYHLYFEDWWQRDTESMIRRDRNHPSIIMWSIGNEVPERTGVSDGYAWAQKQVDFVRSLDDTRWVTAALPFLFEELFASNEFAENIADVQSLFEKMQQLPADIESDRWGNVTAAFCQPLDVVGYNYLHFRYGWDRERFPERVIAGTETFPAKAYDSWMQTEKYSHVIGDFVWTSIDYIGESGIGRVAVDDPRPMFAVDPWPHHLAHCGDIDICGFKRPQSYFRDLLWGVRTTPFIGVISPQLYGKQLSYTEWGWEPVMASWTHSGDAGKPVQVYVYSADDEVELLVNGESVGRQPAGKAVHNKAIFETVYQPGIIEAVGYRNGAEAGRTQLTTAGEPAKLSATADRAAINAAYGDLAYVTIEVVDENGHSIPWADPEISVEVSGAGELIALGTANPESEALYFGYQRQAWQGQLMAVVRSSGQAGEIRIVAKAAGVTAGELRLEAILS